MTTLQKKITTNYWADKLKNFSSGYSEEQENLTSSTDKVLIRKDDLSYFYKLTSGNYIAEFTVLLTMFNALLQRYFEECNLILSDSVSPIEGAPLLFSFHSIKDKTLKQFLNEVKAEVQEVYKHKEYDLTTGKKKSLEEYTPYSFSYDKDEHTSSSFFLKINKQENDDIGISILFSEHFIDHELANHFVQRLKNWLQDLGNNIETQISNVVLISKQEKEKLLFEYNEISTSKDIGKETIITLFEEQVKLTPDAIAIEYEGEMLTYAMLNEKSNRFAYYLRKKLGIKENDFVGVKLGRSEELVIALLAVLKAGAIYVPIDVSYPQERIAYIERDSNCKLVIDAKELDRFQKDKSAYPQKNIVNYTIPEDLAYIIYTSGTTGNPKGVMIAHQNAVALINWAKIEFKDTDYEVVYACTSHCFDLSVFELFYTLSVGKKIRLLHNALEIGNYLNKDTKVLLNTVPSSIRNILEEGYDLKNVSAVNLAGEPFPVDIAQKLLSYDAEIRNLYGPSEDTTYSTAYKLTKNKVYKSIPIGKPIANTKAYILDDQMQLLPPGAIGKLYVAGAGVAKGYLNRPKLTTESFIESPFCKEEFIYNTGDMAKWLPDQNIEFLGRKDHQVKLRGYRIELGEIENAISQFSEDVLQAVVGVKIVKKESVLVGYYVESNSINKSKLRDYLKEQLPSYMIPNHFMAIDTIPLTPNGKVNKKALPEVTLTNIVKKGYIAPRDKVEEELVGIWEEVLGIKSIGIEDHFFELGGHSLMISQIINKIHKQMDMSVSFKIFYTDPTIKSLRDSLKNEEFSSIKRVPNQYTYATTPSQQRLWLLSQLEKGDQAYQISGAVSIEGDIIVENFRSAFTHIIHRHEILRTYFVHNEDGILRQCIIPVSDFEFDLFIEDFSKSSSPYNDVEVHVKEQQNVGYDLSKAPLFKASLLKIEDNKFVFFLSMHHIISDGWSLEILTSEIIDCYMQFESGSNDVLPNLPIQFKDYVSWLEEKNNEDSQKKAKQYWLDKFQGEIPILDLPRFKNRPLIKTYSGKELNYRFSEEILSGLKVFSQKYQVTLFMTLMSGVKALLSRYSNQKDIIVGTPIAGREHPDLESQIGLYINTLAIRTQFDKEDCFVDILQKEKNQLLEAYAHQSYPFDKLVEELRLARDTSRSPLFDVMVVLQNQKQLSGFQNRSELANIKVDEFKIKQETAQFDLSFAFVENKGLSLDISYNTDIYEESFVKGIFLHLENLFEQILISPDMKVEDIDLLTATEKQTLLVDFNDTRTDYPKDKTVVDLFIGQVKKTPDNIALIFEEKKITYRELDEESNRLANFLISNYDVGLEDLVGIKLHRGQWSIISSLAILKAGGAFLSIDSDYPEQRIEYIEKDSNCKAIIDDGFLEAFKREKKTSKTLPDISTKPNNLAYVIYTSGSTGKPKGTLVEHQPIVRLVKNTNYVDVGCGDKILGLSSFSFDGSIFDVFMPLLNGATLVVSSKNIFLDMDRFDDILANQAIDCFFITTALFNTLVESELESVKNLKYILFGGEQVSIKHVRRFKELYPNVRLHHVYGPTENTTYSTYYRIDNIPEGDIQTIPIGSGISNSTCYILDENRYPVPIGVIGEIYLGGDGLARGYLNHEDLTSEKFIPSPFKSEERLYKTGDLAKWSPDGVIEFSGRKDTQVKIRGYRIELGEIENVLALQPNIQQAVVTVQKQKTGSILIAYVVSDSEINEQELKVNLGKYLPEYMIPSLYVTLEIIPLTINGKVDKKSLPEITEESRSSQEYIAPRTMLEQQLVEIWQDVLGIEKIGVTDNFFELGGHSLMISQVINRISKKMGKTVSYELFYNNSTIEMLSHALKDQGYEPIDKVAKSDFYPATPSQQRLWFLSQFEEGARAYHINGAVTLEGDLNLKNFAKSFYYVVDRHEILRTYFKNNEAGVLQQYIMSVSDMDLNISIEDFSQSEFPDQDIREDLSEEQSKAYDLSQAPLLKAKLLKRSNKSFVFFLSMHHIISDGWSLEILTSEIIEGYRQLQLGESLALPDLSIQFKDYAVWLSKTNLAKIHKESKEYWLNVFKEDIPVLELPSFKKRPLVKTYSGNTLVHNYSEEVLSSLKSFSKEYQVTLFMILMSVVKTLLSRYSNQKDIIVGTPIAGREHPDLEYQIGLYLNTLAIRTRFDETDSFLNALQKEKQQLLKAYSNQGFPFDLLVEQLNLKRDTSRSPLFDVMVVLQNQKQLSGFINKTYIKDLIVNEFDLDSQSAQFDLSFAFVEKDNGLSLSISFNTDIYQEFFIKNIFLHLENMLSQVLPSPSIKLGAIDLLTKDQKQIILEEFNDTKISYDFDKTIVDIFEEQVVKTPNAFAVEYEGESLSYNILNELSNQFAAYLIEKRKISKNDFVGVKLVRNEKLLITLLAVLKSGAAYIPIDVNYPKERIDYIEKDSNCKLVIDDNELRLFLETQKSYSVKNTKKTKSSNDLAYVIYTSGTTGKPKGVMITHRNAVSMINWAKDEFKNTDFDTTYASTSHCFDLSVFEIFYTLSVGKKIKLLDSALEIGRHLQNDSKVLLNTVPSSIRNLLDNECDLTPVSAFNLAGEVFPGDIAKQLQSFNAEVRNLYGPSEDTTYSTCYKLSDNATYRSIPIGNPIANTKAYILGDHMQLLPPGVTGKLYLSGAGVAKGYLNQKELTEEKFIENPYCKGERMYDTGDMARWNPEGKIEFLGRQDNQVKVRGYRIELEEIEHVLQEERNINQAVVLIKEIQAEKHIVAYLIGEDIVVKQVRNNLSNKLSSYMIPAHYLIIDSIPLTPNGKIDKEKLLALEVIKSDTIKYVAPKTDIEKRLVTIWQEALGVPKIGITNDFFELGGHSLKATQILSIVDKEFDVSINIQELFTHPTIQNLAMSIENAKWLLEVEYDQSAKKITI
ncbi:non-ribosomal peptide synthetase [Aquimarina sediminis]|uniref:non-ribosomal peptide synthetase n=1 Tax=Aquimarina sediminis TaxID=2070536 RepID=UPI000CA08D4A|nr:non-ribosomal peptide synthetase [Aquimarina sediminis]